MSNYKSALATLAAETRAIREALASRAWDQFVQHPAVKQWMADEVAADFDRGHEMVLPERAKLPKVNRHG